MEASNNNQGSRNLWFLSEIHIVTRTFFPHLEWFVYCNSTMTNNYYMYTLWSTSGISWFCCHLGGSYSNCVWLINFFSKLGLKMMEKSQCCVIIRGFLSSMTKVVFNTENYSILKWKFLLKKCFFFLFERNKTLFVCFFFFGQKKCRFLNQYQPAVHQLSDPVALLFDRYYFKPWAFFMSVE